MKVDNEEDDVLTLVSSSSYEIPYSFFCSYVIVYVLACEAEWYNLLDNYVWIRNKWRKSNIYDYTYTTGFFC